MNSMKSRFIEFQMSPAQNSVSSEKEEKASDNTLLREKWKMLPFGYLSVPSFKTVKFRTFWK